MKICIIDLDGVVADSTERFKRAEEAKQLFLQDKKVVLGDVNAASELSKRTAQVYWQTAFTPELVALDTLIEGVHEALNVLYGEYGVMFVTSRPESMRAATQEWLEHHDISVEHPQFGNVLVMKAPAFQFVKTVTWKAGIVQTLHRLYGAYEVLFLDDEAANRQAVLDACPDGGDFGIVRVASSLAEDIKEVQR